MVTGTDIQMHFQKDKLHYIFTDVITFNYRISNSIADVVKFDYGLSNSIAEHQHYRQRHTFALHVFCPKRPSIL